MQPNGIIPRIGLGVEAVEDLRKSGLEPADIAARAIGPAEIAATNATLVGGQPPIGYVIPYLSIIGAPTKFYRLRLLETSTLPSEDFVRYRQPTGEPNHLYFPPGLRKLLQGDIEYVIITEGEKKACCAVKHGFPAVAVTGVDSWRTRRILLPKDTKLLQHSSGGITAQIPRGSNDQVASQDAGVLANGMVEFIDTLVKRKLTAIIIYDTDDDGQVKMEVQRAAATLGYELRFRGLPINKIRQLVLPAKGAKVGLDDFLMSSERAPQRLTELITSVMKKRVAFPRHPNPIAYIAGRLQKAQLTRKEVQDVAMAILAELEAKGRRFRTVGSDQLHYFDEETRTLYPVSLNNQRIPLHETTFGSYIYREFCLGGSDKRTVEWLATQFSGEPPIDETRTQQVLARISEGPLAGGIAYQTGDSHFAVVTDHSAAPLVQAANGTYGLLFEQGQTETINPRDLESQFLGMLDTPPKPYWETVLKELKIRPALSEDGTERATATQMRTLLTLIYYISPWLHRWRNTQLPIELIVGEAGSGKSSLLSLRQRILTGKTYLSNLTSDMRDWYAGITSRGGVYVMDNVHFSGKHNDFRQQLSDEICRLITEPEPHVEMRKLYTTNTVISLPVRPTLAVTSIEQPFYNSDLLQRAFVVELDAVASGHDSDWIRRQLESRGGRVGWIAHHLSVLHRFLHLAVERDEWNHRYAAHHRLANYEQCLMLMGRVFGMDVDWIPEVLTQTTQSQISEADLVHQALALFVAEQKEIYPTDYWSEKRRWDMQQICEWADGQDQFQKNGILMNTRRLGRYIQSHKTQLASSIKLFEAGKRMNKFVYGIYRHDN